MSIKLKPNAINEAAAEYIEKGWAVMPCLPNKKEPHFGLIRRSHLDATRDLGLVEMWAKLDPEMNLGISAIASGLVIIDIDGRNGGILDDRFTDTYTVKTADGYHLYYRHSEGAVYRNGLGEGYDIKHKGYVVAAPSIHPSGVNYQVINDGLVSDLPLEIQEEICRTSW